MRPFHLAPAAALWLVVLGALPAAAADPAIVADTAKGKTLVDGTGMTLYVFAKDQPDKSTCNGPCATNWPPLKAAAIAKAMGPWTVVTRDDGSTQWAYKSKPLYRWNQDQKPGDVTGDGRLDGAWTVAQP
ncbi:COG4315 family predicted lipoprotein [Xanthobacter sediminis]